MKLVKILFFLSIYITAWSQFAEDSNIPCKPLSMMAKNSERLAKVPIAPGMEDWDVYYYDLDFNVDVDNRILYGKVEIHLHSRIANLESIWVDLSSDLTVDRIYLNGADFQRAGDLINITLDGSYTDNESVKIGIEYHGQPTANGFQAFLFSTQNQVLVGGIPMISTLSEPYGARTWWPCKDVPTDKADSVRIGITVDDNLTAVANGLLTAETDNGDGTKTWIWEHKYPITSYLVSLAITEYDYWSEMYHFADGDSMPLEYWMYPSYVNKSNVARWNLTSNMMTIFNEAYGKYPFSKEKYGMAQFGWGGAMEHQTCSSMGSSGEATIAHELAHQWWGDLVTCSDFHHIWINEGFATYSEALYEGAKNGEAAYHATMAAKDWDYTGSIYRNDTTEVWSIFNYIVYGKGAWTLHMLRHVVGEEDFFNILAQYRKTFDYSHASTEDFQGVAELVYGQDLEWFFNQWIYGTGKPNYQWYWQNSSNTSGLNEVTVRIDQVQDNMPTFKMPIDLFFKGEGQDTTIVVWNSARSETYTVQLDFTPSFAELDPVSWIHKKDTEVSGIDDFNSKPENFILMNAYPNPFNRSTTIPYWVNSYFRGKVEIFDLRGNLKHSVDITHSTSGQYELIWDARDQHGLSLPSGIYLARITSNNEVSHSQKISLLK